MGVVLSRPSETEVSEAAPVLEPLVDPGDVVHVGGPVEPGRRAGGGGVRGSRRRGRGRLRRRRLHARRLRPGRRRRGDLRARCLFVGYAGWSPGQLEAELEEESWLVLEPEPADVFAPDAENLWSSVLARQGGALALLSRMPPDPSR